MRTSFLALMSAVALVGCSKSVPDPATDSQEPKETAQAEQAQPSGLQEPGLSTGGGGQGPLIDTPATPEVKPAPGQPEPKDEPPAFTVAQLAGTYKAEFSKEDVEAAKAQGIDLLSDPQFLTLGKDKSFVLGSKSGKSGRAEGTYEIVGSSVRLSLAKMDGEPVPENSGIPAPSFEVSTDAKSLTVHGPNGRSLVFHRQ